jgi:molecular chaperone DnaK (HSP70)
MADDQNKIEINVESIQTAQEIIEAFTGLKPLSSFSFTLSMDGQDAVNEVLRLVEWGIGKNKSKLKDAALGVISPLAESVPGLPNNVNLTEFEIKSMEEVLSLIERTLSKHKDGVVTR